MISYSLAPLLLLLYMCINTAIYVYVCMLYESTLSNNMLYIKINLKRKEERTLK